ncbi:hypothetical protein OG413_09030 [Streptomyces sp. NBC_01433]|uniref:hypothetical protein n=1 Tax=Streptomyces sp. NBC_01433 TaxID=2903864 RepID=UPI00224D0FDE|nr:hypothetical protein [Streptomyces sp. NBC_01433]MCX4675462.1 hypothetical protein [Streptomyces sp. NBC_01433]
MSGGRQRQRLSDLAGPTGGGAELRHSDGPWTRAAGGAEALRTHMGPVKAELEAAHEGLVAGAGALVALAELGAVRDSWERRIEAARGECDDLAGKLRAVARTQCETNEAVKSAFAPVSANDGGIR